MDFGSWAFFCCANKFCSYTPVEYYYLWLCGFWSMVEVEIISYACQRRCCWIEDVFTVIVVAVIVVVAAARFVSCFLSSFSDHSA